MSSRPVAVSIRHRLLRRAVGPVCVVAGLGLLGCDPADGDQAARSQLQEAYSLRSAGDPQQQYVVLADAAAGTQASPATMAQANELVGDISLQLASATISGPIIGQNEAGETVALPGITGLETRAMVLAEQAHRLANALALGSTYIQSGQQKDPAPVLQGVEGTIGGIRAGEQWAVGGQEQLTLPTLEHMDGRIAQLNQTLEQLNGQIQQLEQQRSQMLAQASQLDQQSDQQQGAQSVATYRQVADLRTEAAQVTTGIDKLTAQVRQTTAELQQSRAMHGALQETISALEAQQAAIRQTWEGVQTQIGQIQETGQQTYAGGEGAGASVESLTQELADTLSRLSTLRDQAIASLQKATGAYGKAAGEARQASGVQNEMFGTAYGDAFDPARISLNHAVALRQLGLVHAGSASVYASIYRLEQTLQESGRELPAALTEAVGSPEQAYRDAITAAADALTQADTMLTDVAGAGARGPLGPSAVTQRAVVLTCLYSLNGLIETTGVQVDAELPSNAEIAEQVKLVTEAAQDGDAHLPLVPPFIGGVGAPPTTQPATQPTTQPATEPATEPTEDVPADEDTGEDGMTDDGDAAADDNPPEGR